ncbi:hypothetical protein [Stutzerimonas chloritidismutans]
MRIAHQASVTLSAADLFSNWGFADGGVLDDVLYDIEDQCPALVSDEALGDGDGRSFSFAHAVLIRLVEECLLPSLPRKIQTYRIPSTHSPIRAEEYESPEGLLDTAVTIPADKVIEIALQIASVQLALSEPPRSFSPD